MKKTFYQFHIRFIYALLICLFFLGVGIAIIVISVVEKKYLLSLVGFIPIVISIHAVISSMYNRVVFLENSIKITGDLYKQTDKTQFKDTIRYNEILDLRIINSNINSKKQKIKLRGYGSITPRLFFEVLLKNQESKLIYISFFSKKQRIQMLNIINEKSGLDLNYDKLIKIDKSYFNINKNNQ